MSEQADAQKGYLSGGDSPDFQILAQTPYKREDLASIAGGADPVRFRRIESVQGSWGLLYIFKGIPGFYVPASESPMAAMIRGPNGSRPEPVYLRFDGDTLAETAFESGRKKDPAGILGVLARFFGLGEKDRFVIAWTGKTGERHSLDFYPLRENKDFFEAFRALQWFRERT